MTASREFNPPIIPNADEIRAGINSLEGIDEQAAKPEKLKELCKLSPGEIQLTGASGLTADFECGYLLGLTAARNGRR